MRFKIPSLAALAGVAAFMIGCDLMETPKVTRAPSAQEAALRAQSAADSAKAYQDSIKVLRRTDSAAAATIRKTWLSDSAKLTASDKVIAAQKKKDSIAYWKTRKADSVAEFKKHKTDSTKYAKDSIAGVKLLTKDSTAFEKKMASNATKYTKDSTAAAKLYTKDSLKWEAAQTTKYAAILAKDSAAIEAAQAKIDAETDETSDKVRAANAARLDKATATLQKHLDAQTEAVAKAAAKMEADLAATEIKLAADLATRAADSTKLMNVRANDSAKIFATLAADSAKWLANAIADSTKWYNDSTALQLKLDTDSSNKFTADTLRDSTKARAKIAMYSADSSFLWQKAAPIFSPVLDTYAVAQTVKFTTAYGVISDSVRIYYTLDGTTPDSLSTLYTTDGIALAFGKTVSAIAYRNGYSPSRVSIKNYVITAATTPSLDDVNDTALVKIDSGWLSINRMAGANIYYTTDGKTPTLASTALDTTTDSLLVKDTSTVKMIAVLFGYKISPVASFKPKVKVDTSAVRTTDTSATYFDSTWVKFSRPKGSRIYYTINGTTPTSLSTAVDTTKDSILVKDTVTIRAVAIRAKQLNSVIELIKCKIKAQAPTVALTTADTNVAAYGSQKIRMTTATPSGTIRYTRDGTQPLVTSTAYVSTTQPAVTVGDTIFAITTKTNVITSDTTALRFLPVVKPTISVVATGDSVNIKTTTTGASIFFSRITGTAPTGATNKASLDTTFAVSAGDTIYAIAVKNGMANSSIDTLKFTKFGAPVISLVATADSVRIKNDDTAAVTYFTRNGSLPTTVVSGTNFKASDDTVFAVSAADTIIAFSTKTGKANSAYDTLGFTKVEIPTLTLSAAEVAASAFGTQTVTLASATTGASIYFTRDGSVPTAASGSLYVSGTPLAVTTGDTIKAIAVKTGMVKSAIDSILFLAVAKPTLTLSKGDTLDAAYGSQVVKLACATSGAVIHYTIDGSAPTYSSPTYGSAISVSVGDTIKAIALKTGLANSAADSLLFTAVATPTYAVTLAGSDSLVTFSSTTASVTFLSTTDGSTPTKGASGTTAGATVTVASGTTKTIKVIAVKDTYANSAIATTRAIVVP